MNRVFWPILGFVAASAIALVAQQSAPYVLTPGLQQLAGAVTITGVDSASRALVLPSGAIAFGATPAVAGNILRVPNNVNVIAARNQGNSADLNLAFLDTNNLWNLDPNATGILYTPKLFTNLGTPANGAFYYCSDCTLASPCAGAGTGAFAKRLNGIWVCN